MTMIKRFVLGLFLVGGLFGATSGSAQADQWCARVGLHPGADGKYDLPAQPPVPLYTHQCVPAP